MADVKAAADQVARGESPAGFGVSFRVLPRQKTAVERPGLIAITQQTLDLSAKHGVFAACLRQKSQPVPRFQIHCA
jgi:hypothetical protein